MIALKCNELSKENQDQLIREFVEKVCEEEGEFVFIVGRFSPKFRPLYDINKPMQKLCENIVKYTRQLIKKLILVDNYIGDYIRQQVNNKLLYVAKCLGPTHWPCWC